MKKTIKRWFVVAKGKDDPDPVHFEWATSSQEAARMSAEHRRESPPWKLLVVQLGPPQGHPIGKEYLNPPGTDFYVPPLKEPMTISEVLNEKTRWKCRKFGRVNIKGQWWVNDTLSVTPA